MKPTWFYSDPHFGHAAIIDYCNRPFDSLESMDAALERAYATRVGAGDLVLWCGDVSMHDDAWTRGLLRRLPGHKALVRGNHDGTIAHCLALGFDFVVDFLHLQIAGCKVTASHHPPLGTPGDQRYANRQPPKPDSGQYVLHGHTHERARMVGRRIHVGVDAWDFAPASYPEVESLIREAKA